MFRIGRFRIENEQAGFAMQSYLIVNQSYNYPALSWRTVSANPARYFSMNELIYHD